MKIAFLTNVARAFYLFRSIEPRLLAEMPRLAVEGTKLEGSGEFTPELAGKLLAADFRVFLWMGSGLDSPVIQRAVSFMKRRGLRYIALVENAQEDETLLGATVEERNTAWRYFRYDGADNFAEVFRWLGRTFGGLEYDVKPPKALPWHGVWHPAWRGDPQDIEGYLSARYDADRPTAGIVFYRTEWLTGDFTSHKALAEAFEAAGMNVIMVFTNTVANEAVGSPTFWEAVEKYFYRGGKRLIDVLVCLTKFSLTAAGTPVSLLQKLNVPILEAYEVLATREEWEKSPAGLDPMETSISVALPEFDGVIHSVPVAAKRRLETGETVYEPFGERMARLASKARKWAELSRKPNDKKKVAIVFHNYPPTNSNVGSAAGLDSPESVRRLMAKMKDAGYTIDKIPADSREFMELLLANATNDRRFISEAQVKGAYGHLTAKEYAKFFRALPQKAREELREAWGEEPGDVFNYDGELLVPGTLNGNIFITVQPPRGFGEDPGKILHDPACPPTHHYIGYYHWLRDVWRADAVVHVGTHGSLEWLPGKSTGLSNACYPDISLGDLPDVYPYWMTIVGEGIQAKRRGAACLVSHLSPPMRLSGSYEEMAELENALEEYIHFAQTQPDNLAAAEELVREKAAACNFGGDIAEGEDFADYAGRLHNYVTDIKNMQIRTGLHILGEAPGGDDLVEYLQALLRLDNKEAPSLLELCATEAGYDYDSLLKNSDKVAPDGETYGVKLDRLEKDTHALIEFLSESDFCSCAVTEALALPAAAKMSAKGKKNLEKILRYVCEEIVPNIKRTEQEITNVLRALYGEYIEPSPAGAPTAGGADLLPTGRNFYGLDPRLLPTPTAYELGGALADGVISDFIASEGRYPEECGVVFWAGANMRTHGQCIAEFMQLMGVRPIWQRPGMLVIGIEAVSLEELKRPRIDVLGRISGLFRDTMPEAIKWLDEAVKLVAALDESDEENYVRKHVKADAAQITGEGEDEAAAWRKASLRIFGCPPGAYGAGVAHLLESKRWETLDDLADVYTRWSGTAYSGDALPGEYLPKVFRRHMGRLDATIKNEDNRETNMFSSDDYNAYHGGMIAAVRAISGKAPRSYAGDSSDRKRVKVRTVQDEAKRVFRAELMNPKYIEGMKKHGYKGALELANALAHSYQWDATSKVLEDWMYEKFAEKYALDEDMKEWFKDVNPWALERMADILLEAEQRGLWRAKEETKGALKNLYLEMEGELEERGDV